MDSLALTRSESILHTMGSLQECARRVGELMREVGLNVRYRNQSPQRFSGSQRQRGRLLSD